MQWPDKYEKRPKRERVEKRDFGVEPVSGCATIEATAWEGKRGSRGEGRGSGWWELSV